MAWKVRWAKECLFSVVTHTLTAEPPKYSVILDLDRRIRDLSLPQFSQRPLRPEASFMEAMTHSMPNIYLHACKYTEPLLPVTVFLRLFAALLYIHRSFFASALIDHPADPMRSQYAPSFLAGYRSATALLGTVRDQFALYPQKIARYWIIWGHAFSACVSYLIVVALVVASSVCI